MNFSFASRSRGLVLFFFTFSTLWSQPPRNRAAGKPAATPASAAVPVSPRAPELKLVAQFDRDGDQQLDQAERTAARAFLAQHPEPIEPPNLLNPLARDDAIGLEASKPGEKISAANSTAFSAQPLYEPHVVRTVFIEFDDKDWEQELTEFARTDVQVPARLTVDGKSYRGVGVHFLSAAPNPLISPGYKRSLDLTLDFTVKGERIDGERQLQLRATPTDPTYLRAFLYQRVAREYFPTPKINFVQLVINGENWGIYANLQPLDAAFTQENFGSADGTRWLASGRGQLGYRGNDPAAYHEGYRLLSEENPAAWTRLAELCQVLDRTPISELEAALRPYLDLDRTLKFLAVETALINQGGYGSATGSYGLYLDPSGRFHLVSQDTDSSFRLLQIREVGTAPAVPRNRAAAPSTPSPPVAGLPPPVEIPVPVPPNGTPSDFPRRTDTDLAMLLSYSFINKVDADNDSRLTRDEWLRFARAWFLVIDEDQAGVVSRDQFIASVRNFVTPPSMRNPKAKQTFAEDDAAFLIGQDLFGSMAHDASNRVDRDGFVAAFAKWFTDWADPKSGQLTQPSIQRGLNSVLSQSVFAADQLYVKRSTPLARDDEPGPNQNGGRGGGGRGDASGFSPQLGLSLPGGMRLGGGGGRGARGGNGGRTVLTFNEELHPLTWAADSNRPLFTKLLAVPSFRARYIGYLEEISNTWLSWEKLGPVAKEAHQLIARQVEHETHRVFSYVRFVQELDQDTTEGDLSAKEMGETLNLKAFIAERRTYLLKQITH